jgi:hypothetical protein
MYKKNFGSMEMCWLAGWKQTYSAVFEVQKRVASIFSTKTLLCLCEIFIQKCLNGEEDF